jgi:hypothetical protein
MSITHSKVSAKSDGGDATLVLPSDWNAGHTITGMAGAGWVDWSPIVKAGANTATWTGTAKYLDTGAVVYWYFNVTFTSSVASGVISITGQPTPLQNHDGGQMFGHGIWLDQGVNFYLMGAWNQTATEWRFYRDAGGGTQFTVAIGNSPADSANFWGVVTHSTDTLDIPSVGNSIGAAVYKAADLALSTSGEANLTLDTELYDTDGFHDNSTNNQRFTIPAGLGGKYIVGVHGRVDANNNAYLIGRLNGSAIVVFGSETWNSTSSFGICTDVAIVNLAAGDYIEFKQLAGGATNMKASGGHQAWAWIALVTSGTSAYSGARWGSGTAFPSGPATNDRFTRTDLTPRDYYYDGTRWVSETVYEINAWTANITVTPTDVGFYAAFGNTANSMWLIDYRVMYQVSTTHSGTQYWTMELWDASSGGIAGTLATTSKSGTGMQTIGPTAIGSVQPSSTVGFYTHAIKISTAGPLLFSYIVRYRIIAV